MLGDLISSSDAKVDTPLTNKGGNIGGWEEDDRYGKILDQCNIKPGGAPEVDGGSGKKIEA